MKKQKLRGSVRRYERVRGLWLVEVEQRGMPTMRKLGNAGMLESVGIRSFPDGDQVFALTLPVLMDMVDGRGMDFVDLSWYEHA